MSSVEESASLATGTVPSAADGKITRAIIIARQAKPAIVIMNWDNIRSKIVEYRPLSGNNGVLRGSAFFLTRCKTVEELREIEDAALVVTDLSGKQSVHPVTIKSEWIERASICSINPRIFDFDRLGRISYPNEGGESDGAVSVAHGRGAKEPALPYLKKRG